MYANKVHPSLRSVGRLSCNNHPKQGEHRDENEERGGNFEILTLDIEHHHHAEETENEDADMLDEGRKIAASFVS